MGVAVVGLTLAGAAGAAWTASRRASVTALLVAALLAAAGVVSGVALLWGSRARDGIIFEQPAPDVVGLDVDRAKALLRRPGPVRIVVVRVPYAPRDQVVKIRETSIAFDGTYTNRSRVVLIVGDRPPGQPPATASP